jgi:hypothetical protein
MRNRLCAISLLGLVAVCSASAQTPATERPGKASAGKLKPGNASAGSSAVRATTPEDAGVAHEREADERRATEAKEKMKKRPGYKDQVPTPRV